ncbi:MAG: hypothetical protein H8E53_01965 [Planctomycetes bacterium]|nr:hypothetical protein [Planctomycetota bacterium]
MPPKIGPIITQLNSIATMKNASSAISSTMKKPAMAANRGKLTKDARSDTHRKEPVLHAARRTEKLRRVP